MVMIIQLTVFCSDPFRRWYCTLTWCNVQKIRHWKSS